MDAFGQHRESFGQHRDLFGQHRSAWRRGVGGGAGGAVHVGAPGGAAGVRPSAFFFFISLETRVE